MRKPSPANTLISVASPHVPQHCTPWSVETMSHESVFVRDYKHYLRYAKAHPEHSSPRSRQATIFFRCTLGHPLHGLLTRIPWCTCDVKMKGARNVLALVWNDANYLHYDRWTPRRCCRLLQPGPNVLDANLYDHAVQSFATKHNTWLPQRQWTAPLHLEWTT